MRRASPQSRVQRNGELVSRLPRTLAAEATVLVDEKHRRVPENFITPHVLLAVIVDLWERPAIPAKEVLGLLWRVVDVRGGEGVFRMFLGVVCEGNLLSVAVRSPGCVDLDEEGLVPKGDEGNLFSAECRAANLGNLRAVALSVGF